MYMHDFVRLDLACLWPISLCDETVNLNLSVIIFLRLKRQASVGCYFRDKRFQNTKTAFYNVIQ